MKEALFYNKHNDGKVECKLCPHNCLIRLNYKGLCNVRRNVGGILYSDNYGVLSAIALDPVEKKPLRDFMPGTKILSIGSVGCNLFCDFCQNWQISRAADEAVVSTLVEYIYTPEQIVQMAIDSKSKGNIGLAYTYNEPTVWLEFIYDAAYQVKEAEMQNVMVSNGYINARPLQMILPFIDAFNIDLKASGNEFYNRLTKSSIDPVFQTISMIDKARKHLEITYLVIPGKNDNPAEFQRLMESLSRQLTNPVSLHINRYFPAYRMKIEPTSLESLLELQAIAKRYFERVYIGNT